MIEIADLKATQDRIVRALPDITGSKKVDTVSPPDRTALERLKHMLGLER